ncbi:hypothetical protein Gohar_024947, partial [Gossypium harknessii]|nr:hypothetical protein [Gossypium harknessii]
MQDGSDQGFHGKWSDSKFTGIEKVKVSVLM